MNIDHESLSDNIVKISLEGSMDIAGSNKVDEKLASVINNSKNYILDLNKVSFLCSLGIRVLILAAKNLSMQGGKLVLVNPQGIVRNVVEISGIEQLIPVYSSIENAVAALNA